MSLLEIIPGESRPEPKPLFNARLAIKILLGQEHGAVYFPADCDPRVFSELDAALDANLENAKRAGRPAA